MAIKVVQGLVETGLGTRGAATVRPNSTTNQSSLQTSLGTQVQLQQAQQAIANNAASSQVLQGQAVVSYVRSNNISNDGKKIKDPDAAKELADAIADKIRDREEQGLSAHSGLTSVDAREHFNS